MYEYALRVEDDRPGPGEPGHSVAYLGEPSPDNPFRGEGSTPLEAVRSLCERIREWPVSGAEKWFSSPDGLLFQTHFIRPKGSA